VAVQLKTFTPEGIATSMVSAENTMVANSLWPDVNMWWPHTRKPEEREAQRAHRDGEVAEDRAREKVAKSSLTPRHARHDHDVDGGVRVEPEEVLEEHRVAAERGVEDAEAEHALHREEQRG
jgi:hypothetical protein